MKAKFPPLSARRVVLRFPNPPPAWEGRRVDHVILAVWTIGILIWTVARFIIPVVVFWQFLRMLWYWNTPDVHAGWQFLAYYAVYIALYIFFGVYEPKLYREKNRGRPNG